MEKGDGMNTMAEVQQLTGRTNRQLMRAEPANTLLESLPPRRYGEFALIQEFSALPAKDTDSALGALMAPFLNLKKDNALDQFGGALKTLCCDDMQSETTVASFNMLLFGTGVFLERNDEKWALRLTHQGLTICEIQFNQHGEPTSVKASAHKSNKLSARLSGEEVAPAFKSILWHAYLSKIIPVPVEPQFWQEL
jgi:hypothetical protein